MLVLEMKNDDEPDGGDDDGLNKVLSVGVKITAVALISSSLLNVLLHNTRTCPNNVQTARPPPDNTRRAPPSPL